MSDNPNDENNPLNDAVENSDPSESNSESGSSGNPNNQQSTTTSTAATGAEALDAQIAEAEQDLSGDGGDASGSDSSEGSNAEDDASPDAVQSSDAQSNVVDSQLDSGESSGGEGVAGLSEEEIASALQAVGIQSVGGDDIAAALQNPDFVQVAQGIAQNLLDGNVSADDALTQLEEALNDNDPDTETTTESFDVTVEEATDEATAEGEDFATETVSETFQMGVTSVNDGPEVGDAIALNMQEDGSLLITQEQLLANASDVDGDDLTAQNLALTDSSQGTIVDNGDGTFSFTPSQDFNGNIDFTFDVSDGQATTQSSLSVDVASVNDAATSEDLDLSGSEDSVVTITQADLLANAVDVDGDSLTASNLSIDPSFGTVTDNGDGTFSFAPSENYNGDVPFSFDISDGTATTRAHGNLDVAAVNDEPVLAETSFAITEDNSIVITEAELLANTTDVDADSLSVSNISAADGNGSVTQNEDGNWVYTPNEHFSGEANLTISINDGTVTADFNSVVTVDADADAPSLNVSLQQMSVADFGDANIQGGVLQGWQTDNQSGGIEVHQDTVYGVGDDRGLVMELEAAVGDEGNVYQNLDIEAGDTIELSFDISARAGHAGANSQVDLYFEGQLIDSILPDVGWESHTYTLTATTDNPRLELDAPGTDGGGAVLDVIRISEPVASQEETAIGLDIDAALVDTDGSESMQSIQVDAIPEGAILTDGTNTFTATADNNSVDVLGWDMSSITITTPENFAGDVTLQVTATSEEGANGDTASTTSDLTFTVEDVNDAVVIDADNVPEFNATEDTAFTITEAALLANASDVDSEDLIVTNLQIPNATFNTVVDAETGDKSFIVTPDENFNGDVDISFSVSDQEGSVVESGASLTVAAVNDGPVAEDDAAATDEDSAILIDVLANDSDVEGDVSIQSVEEAVMLDGVQVGTAEIVDVPVIGQVELNPSDATATSNLYGNQLLDDDSWSAGNGININGVNYDSGIGMHPEDGLATATFDIPEGATNFSSIVGMTDGLGNVNVDVLVDGVAVFNQNVHINNDGTAFNVDVTDASTLTLRVHSNGTKDNDHFVWAEPEFTAPTGETEQQIQFTPNDNFDALAADEQANVSIDYVIVDSEGATDSATVNVTVTGTNDAVEVSGNVSASLDEDGSLTLTQDDLLANASDLDGDDLAATNLSVGDNATVTDNGDGTFTVTPDANFNGELDLTFDVSDGNGSTIQSGVDVTVNAVNDAATTSQVDLSGDEDTTITITDAQLLANASDVDGDSLSIENLALADSDTGTLVDNGDGTYSFTPNAEFNGDVGFTYGINDGTEVTDGTAVMTVNPVNDLPVMSRVDFDTTEDGALTVNAADILANASDIDGDILSVTSISSADANSAVVDNGDGTFTITPSEDFSGAADLNITISDGTANVDFSSTLNVVEQADAAELVFAIDRGTEIVDTEIFNEDFEGITAGLTDIDQWGWATSTPSNEIEVNAETNYLGAYATGDHGQVVELETYANSSWAGIYRQADGVEAGDTFTLTFDAAARAGDTGDDGITIRVQTANGYEYQNVEPVDGGGWGSYEFTYTAQVDNPYIVFNSHSDDGAGGIMDNIRVVRHDEVPERLLEDQVVNLELSAVSTDNDGSEDLTLVLSDIPAGVTLSDGTNSYTPEADGGSVNVDNWNLADLTMMPPENFNGDISITATATTSEGDSSETVSETITATIEAVNDAVEVGDNISATVDEDGSFTLSQEDLLANASDIDGDDLTAQNLQSDNATITDNGDGTFTVAPDENFNGDLDLSFDVTDGNGSTVSSNVDVTVNAVNDAAVGGEPTIEGLEDRVIRISEEQLLEGATDVDGDTLSVQNVSYSGDDGVLREGNAIEFGDGKDGNIEIDNIQQIDAFSFEIDLTSLQTDNSDAIDNIIGMSAPGEQNALNIYVPEDGNGVMIDLNGSPYGPIATDVNYQDGDQHILTLTWDGATGETNVYENGALIDTATIAPGSSINAGGIMTIGQEQDTFGGGFAEHQATTEMSFGHMSFATEVMSAEDVAAGSLADSGANMMFDIRVDEGAIVDTTGNQSLTVEGDVSISSGWEFIPNDDFTGAVTLDYEIFDGTEATSTTATINVADVNDAAVASDNTLTATEDTAYQLSAADFPVTDADGDSYTVTIDSIDGEGSLILGATDVPESDFVLDTSTNSSAEGVTVSTSADGEDVYNFDAATDVIDLDTKLEIGDTWTISVDFQNPKLNDDAWSTLTRGDQEDGGNHHVILHHSTNELGVYSNDEATFFGSGYYFTADENDGAFHNLTAVGEGGETHFYVDGVFVGTSAHQITVPISDVGNFDGNDDSIGDGQPFAGAISNFEVFDEALSADQINSHVNGPQEVQAGDSFTLEQLDNLSFVPDADANGEGLVDIEFHAVDENGLAGDSATLSFDVTAVNDAADVSGLAATINEDGTFTFSNDDLLATASDVDGDTLTVDSVSYSGTDGVLADNGDGTYSFAPNENFNGEISFDYGISDGTEVTSANIDLTVDSINDAPLAGSTSFSMDEDGVITITNDQLLANSSDVEGDALSVTNVDYSGDDGALVNNGDGTYTFTPNANFNGDVSLSVTISDGTDVSNTTADIDVAAVNDLPSFPDPTYTMDEDTTIVLTADDIISQATDLDGDALTLDSVSYSGDDGVLVDNGDDTFSFTPTENFNGDIDLIATVNDGTATVDATVHLQVDAVNDVLTNSGDIAANTDEDTSIIVTQAQLLANAADIDGDALTASNLQSDHASIVDNGDGTFTITPDADLNGLIDVSYDISDGVQPVAANLGLTVDPVNDAPVVSADVALTIEEDGSYTITQDELLQFASDIDGDSLTANIGDQGSETTVTGTVLDAETGSPVSGADVTLSDAAGNATTVQTDNSGNYSVTGQVSGDGTVTIEQDGAITNSFGVEEGATTNGGTISLSDVMDAGDMRIVVTWGGESGMRDLDNHLWLYDADTGAELDHIYYQDMSHQLGDGTVQQDVDDVNGYGPETITVPNYAEANMHYSVHNYSARAWDVDGVDNVQVQVFVGESLVSTFTPDLPDDTTGDHWHVFDVVDGIIVPAQFAATESSFSVPDAATVAADPDAVSISDVINGVDDSESSSNEQSSSEQSSEDQDSGDQANAGVADIAIANGTVTDNGDGSYTITPNADFNGDLSISYTVEDGNGGVAPAQIDVTVTGTNDATVLQDQAFTVAEDGSITITDAQLLNGAIDVDGDTLTVESVSYEGSDGILTANGDGTYTFAPNENFNGNVDLSYAVSDGTETSSANIDISVSEVNDVPVVSGNLAYSIDEDGVITFNQDQLLVNASDIDGDSLTATNLSAGDNATVVDNGDGSFTVTPDANFNGELALTFDVSDGNGSTVQSGVDLTVNAVNDAAVGGEPTIDGAEDSVLYFRDSDLLQGATDVEGDELSVQNVSYSGDDGTLDTNAGAIVYGDDTTGNIRVDNFEGLSEFSIEIDMTSLSDNHGPVDNLFGLATSNANNNALNIYPREGSNGIEIDLNNQSINLDGPNLYDGESHVITLTWNSDDGQLNFYDNGVLMDSGTISAGTPIPAGGVLMLGQEQDSLGGSLSGPQAATDMQLINVTVSTEEVSAEDIASGSLTTTSDQLILDVRVEDGAIVDTTDNHSLTVSGDVGIEQLYAFTPNENFNGEVELEYQIFDGTDTTDTTATLDLAAINDAATVGDVNLATDEDTALIITQAELLANASDLEGDSLSVVSLSSDDGSVVDNGNGTYTFTPNENLEGDASFSFDVSDGTDTTTATANVDVASLADAPEVFVNYANSVEFASEDFNNGIEGWDGNAYSTSSGGFGTGDAMGLDMNSAGISKEFAVPEGAESVTLSFTAHEVESWDGEQFQVFVNDELFVVDTFMVNDGETGTEAIFNQDGDEVGAVVHHAQANHIGHGPWQEQAHTYTLEVPIDPNTGTVKIGFDNTLDGGYNDERLQIDDFSLSANYEALGNEDTAIDLDFGANLTDTDGSESLSIVLEDVPDGAILSAGSHQGDGVWAIDESDLAGLTITPPAQFNGEFDLTVKATSTDIDGNTATSTDTLTVVVEDVNDAVEISANLSATVDEDGSFTLSQEDLLANASDLDGDDLTAQNLQSDNATITDNGDGTFTVAPDENFNGDLDVSFDVTDGNGSTVSSNVDVTVNAVNDAATTSDVGLSGSEDTTITITQADLLANAADVDGDVLTAVNLTIDSSFGTLTDNGDGSWSFEPAQDFNGSVPMSYQIDDGTVQTPATGNINLAAVNDLPTLDSEVSFTATEDEGLVVNAADILANASDVDGDTLSVTDISSTDGNTTVINNNDGTFTIYGDDNFAGTDNLEITISDGTDSATFSSSVEVAGTADEPFLALNLDTAPVHTFTVTESGWQNPAVWGWSTDNTGGDGGAGFNNLVEVNQAASTYGVDGATEGTVLELEGYSNDAGNLWKDLDIQAGETFTIEFDISGRNNLDPQSNHVKLHFEGEEIDQLIPEVGFTTVSYTLTATEDNPRFEFEAAFNDGAGALLDRVTVTKAELSADEDNAVAIDISAALADTDGSESLEVEIAGLVEDAILSDGTNTFTATADDNSVDVTGWDLSSLSMTPPANFNGDASLTATATATDTGGDTASSTIDIPITINSVNDEVQVGDNLTATIDEDGSFTLTQEELLANASDLDGDDLTAQNLQSDNATITDNGDGTFTVAPDENFNGDLDVSFDVTDGNGSTVSSNVDVTVNAVNDAPVAADDGNVGSLVLDGDDSLILGVGNNDVHGQVTSMWFKIPEDADGPQGLFGVLDPGNGNDRDLYLNDDGDLVAYTWDSAGQSDYTTTDVGDLADGEWHHVVYSLGNGGNHIYIDGELAASGDLASSDFGWSSAMTVGTSVMAEDMTGEIRDFQTYTNISADQDDVNALMRGDTLETTQGVEPQFRMQFEEGAEFEVTGSNASFINGTPTITGNPEVTQSLDGSTIAADDVITNFDVLANDFDVDGDSFSITGLSDVVDADGVVLGTLNVVDVDGVQQVQFMPDSDALSLQFGELTTAQFTYTITDENGATDTANVAFKLEGTNSTPSVTENLAVSVDEDGSITLTQADLLTHAVDADGDSLTADNLAITGDAALTDNGDGTFTITPDADFNGEIGISFDVTDGDRVVQGGADLTVNAVNDLPITSDVSGTTAEDTSITVTQAELLANASDIDGDNLTAENLTANNAMITDNGDGTFSILPDPNFNGEIEVNYDINDGTGTTQGSMNLDVTAVNDAAVVDDASFTVNEDGSLTITDAQLLANATDVDGDTLSIDSVTYTGTDGILTNNGDGTHTFAPNENFNGEIGGGELSYGVSDGTEVTTADIDITVDSVNDNPIVSDGLAYSVDEDGSITFSQAQLLANASDVEGDALTAELISAANASITDNGDGTFTVSPDANFNGDIDISFNITDGDGSTSSSIDLTVNPVNDAPIVAGGVDVSEDFSGNADGWVAAGDATIADGDATLTEDVSQQAGAILYDQSMPSDQGIEVSFTMTNQSSSDNGDGMGFALVNGNEVDASNFEAGNAGGNMGIAGMDGLELGIGFSEWWGDKIQIWGDGNSPVATIDISDNSIDNQSIPVNITISPEGVLNVEMSYDGGTTFTPVVENFSLADNGINLPSDVKAAFAGGTGGSTAEHSIDDISIMAAGGAASSSTIDEDTSITITQDMLLENASDIEGDALTASNLAVAEGQGTVVDNGDGTFTVTPDADFNGSLELSYNVSDGTDTTEATYAVNVDNVNDAAEAGSVTPLTMDEDGSMEIDPDYILGFASDVDGDDLSLTSLTLRDPNQGTLTQNAQTGTYSFSPAANFAGAVAIDYVINDGTEDTAGSMEVNVTAVNDAAFVDGNSQATVMEDGAITFNADELLNLFGDVDGDNLTISNVITADGEEAEGEVVDNGDGTFTFTPEENFAGTTELQVIVSDGTVETAMDMPVYVRPVADGAVITKSQDGPIVMNEDETGFLSLSVDLLDASESLTSLVMTGYPVGFTISDGEHSVTITEEGQLILINDWDISNISMDPPENWHGTFEVTVTATTVDYGDQNADALPDSSDITGDFDATEGQDLILTELDLLDMAENTEVQDGDGVGLVHLIDNSQGTLVDNGDGTWTFSPADGFTGEVDFAYVIQRDGELFDEQSSIGVQPADPSANNGPEIDGIATTDIDKGNSVEFTDADLLAQISDADGDDLSITGVQITDGGGVLEQASDGTYTYTPDPEFSGEAQISFVASDGTDSVTSFVNVNVINAAPEVVAADQASGFTVDEDGSITLTEAELLSAAGATDADGDTMSVEGLGVQPDSGTVINNGDGSWTVWPDPDFSGDMQLTFLVNDGTDSTPASLPLTVTPENDAPTESAPLDVEMDVNGTTTLTLDELLANVTDVDGDNLSVSNFQSDNATVTDNGDDTYSIVADGDFQGTTDITYDVSDGTETIQASISANISPAEDGQVDGEAADYTAAPGASLNIAMPSSISGDDSVDHVIVSDLPDGTTISNGLEDNDGNYVISGDLSQPIQVSLGDGFEGDVSINVTGYDAMDQAVDGASETIGVEVDDAYAMQGSSADGANVDVGNDDQSGGDWTNADNTDSGVDVMDDSSSFDNTNDNSGSNDDMSDIGGIG